MQIVTGKVSGIKKYGAFVELEANIVGLLNNYNEDLKDGEEVQVQIIKIDKDNKKIEFKQV
jgi:predicted RNA-binding protein with RPS1 domain